jgi:hypothetical protein
MGGLLTNGKGKVLRRLSLRRCAIGCVVIVLGGVVSSLPSQDWISPETLKKILFGLGTLMSVIKGVEMFYDQTAAMVKSGDFDTEFLEKEKEPPKE